MPTVRRFDSWLIASGGTGRGAVVTNRPLFNPTAFDRTHFEGELPTGWEAELYRNGELLGFTQDSRDQRYPFDDVALLYGENEIEIRLYGPQGQLRSRTEIVNVANSAAPPGKTWYWAGVNQTARHLISLHPTQTDPSTVPKVQATAALEHGLDARTSIGVAATMRLVDDERLTYVEGTVRRSIGRALVEAAATRDNDGGIAARADLLAKVATVSVSGEVLYARNFRLNCLYEREIRQAKLAVAAPLHLGRTVLPAGASFRIIDGADQTRELVAAARLFANIGRFNPGTDGERRQAPSARLPRPERQRRSRSRRVRRAWRPDHGRHANYHRGERQTRAHGRRGTAGLSARGSRYRPIEFRVSVLDPAQGAASGRPPRRNRR
ncbi:MAG: hypothetical protein NVS3B5_20960 [Sphingomicrobium sp.]